MRTAEIIRNTKETNIKLKINLDGNGKNSVDTKVGFFNHMLTLFSVHSGIDFDVDCNGDIDVDDHHTVEDVGIALGQAIETALGEKIGINRYASVVIPMDETLVTTTLDISGRPFLVFNADKLSCGMIKDFDCQLVEEFMRAVAFNAKITLHINMNYGSNNHHIAEAIFKGFARALKDAVKVTGTSIPSSKGII